MVCAFTGHMAASSARLSTRLQQCGRVPKRTIPLVGESKVALVVRCSFARACLTFSIKETEGGQ